MSRLDTSPLGAELDDARAEGRSEVLELVGRRRARVRATWLPGDGLTTEQPVDAASVRGEGTARAVREMWWLMDVEGGDGD